MAQTKQKREEHRNILRPVVAASIRWCGVMLLSALMVLPADTILSPSSVRSAEAADPPYGHGDITLGASYQALAAALDFRDIHAAVAEQGARKAAKPDLGRRGYGCARRDDAYADVTCVSHDEKIAAADTREIRLQFLNGVLQQFSITADLPHFAVVLGALQSRHGPAQEIEPASEGRYASYRWRNGASSIVAYSGRDVVFVSFELATYAEAVKNRQTGGGRIVVEPRLSHCLGISSECFRVIPWLKGS